MKAWNGCIQYWMGVYVYKRFPYKSLRTIATLTLSAVWHGWAPGYFFCICQIPLFLLSEDVFLKIYKQMKEDSLVSSTPEVGAKLSAGILGKFLTLFFQAKKAMWMLLWYERTTCMAYLGMPFMLLDFYDSIHYYKVVYCSGHFIALLLYVVARYLQPRILQSCIEGKDKDK